MRQQISDYCGATGINIELVCTENNSDSGAQGRQSTSLVNGLYYADSLGQLARTEFNAPVWWDLRNGTDRSGSFDETICGWRTYGDLGMINGLSTRHPTFYAAKLMQSFAQSGPSRAAPAGQINLSPRNQTWNVLKTAHLYHGLSHRRLDRGTTEPGLACRGARAGRGTASVRASPSAQGAVAAVQEFKPAIGRAPLKAHVAARC